MEYYSVWLTETTTWLPGNLHQNCDSLEEESKGKNVFESPPVDVIKDELLVLLLNNVDVKEPVLAPGFTNLFFEKPIIKFWYQRLIGWAFLVKHITELYYIRTIGILWNTRWVTWRFFEYTKFNGTNGY